MRNVEIWKCLKMRRMVGVGWKTKCDKGFTLALHFRLVFEGYLRGFRTFESWNFTSKVESVQKACLRASGRIFRMQTSNAATIRTGVLGGRNSLHLAAGKILAITRAIWWEEWHLEWQLEWQLKNEMRLMGLRLEWHFLNKKSPEIQPKRHKSAK